MRRFDSAIYFRRLSMGSVTHFAIIVTGDEEDIAKARAELLQIALSVEGGNSDHVLTPAFKGQVNYYWTFMVLPTGSKYDGEECHKPYVDKLRALCEGDQSVHDDYTKGPVDTGGLLLEWVYVAYGIDHGKAKVLADCMEEDQ
jgi:hypothetical protein